MFPARDAATSDDSDRDNHELKQYHSFKSLSLHDDLLRGIYENRFERTSHIQEVGLAPMLAGRDAYLKSRCGTGKTTAFCISVLHRAFMAPPRPEAPCCVYLCPQQEDVHSIAAILRNLGNHVKDGRCACKELTGISRAEVVDWKQERPSIVVGTPRRVLEADHCGVRCITSRTADCC